jgi:hypothetical protein
MNESLMTGSAEEAPEAQAAEPTEATQETQVPPSERPEWLPEKFKSAEDLANAYKSLEGKLGSKEEELRKSIVQELEAEAFKDRPESAGNYQLPDFVDEGAAVDNEALKWWSEHAFENGYSQEEFEQGIQMYAQAVQGNAPDLEAEAKKLGDTASQRIDAASAFANKFFPQEAIPAIERMCETAEGIMALEHIMESMKDGSFSDSSSPADQINEDSLRAMMQDERYHHPVKRDPAFIKKVEEGFRKLYG